MQKRDHAAEQRAVPPFPTRLPRARQPLERTSR
jgi:hypothetical protein